MDSERVVVAGGPRTGKTTFAESLGIAPVRHTDDAIALGWSQDSAEVATWFDAPGPWVIEGVGSPRALRKWLAEHPEGKPCDVVLWFSRPHVTRTSGQKAMAKGCDTVWNEVVGALRARGVQILKG